MIIHNIHGIISITIAEVHMIQTSSLFLQYHEVKVTCCLATVHQKCVGLASTGVCVCKPEAQIQSIYKFQSWGPDLVIPGLEKMSYDASTAACSRFS